MFKEICSKKYGKGNNWDFKICPAAPKSISTSSLDLHWLSDDNDDNGEMVILMVGRWVLATVACRSPPYQLKHLIHKLNSNHWTATCTLPLKTELYIFCKTLMLWNQHSAIDWCTALSTMGASMAWLVFPPWCVIGQLEKSSAPDEAQRRLQWTGNSCTLCTVQCKCKCKLQMWQI